MVTGNITVYIAMVTDTTEIQHFNVLADSFIKSWQILTQNKSTLIHELQYVFKWMLTRWN